MTFETNGYLPILLGAKHENISVHILEAPGLFEFAPLNKL
jgi:hypothetical protein